MAEADALRLARRKFLAAQRIDMTSLAAELGVNRVTLYRWVGSRDALMVEVVWSLAAQTLASAAGGVRVRGSERIVAVITRF
jgi:AcrR family transcriptional regulator